MIRFPSSRSDDTPWAVPGLIAHPWEARLGVVWRVVERIGVLIALSLAWVLALGTIVLLPAVTAAILRVTLARARGCSPAVLPELVAGLREGWRPATAIGLLSGLVSVVLVADLWVLASEASAVGTALRAGVAVLAAWWALVSIHLWALVGGTGMPIGRIVRAAIGLSLIEMPSTAIALVASGTSVLLLAAVPPALVLIGPGLVATIWATFAWRAIRRHLGPDAIDTRVAPDA